MKQSEARLFTRGTMWLCLLLFVLNLYVCRNIFRLDYSHHWGSIEGAYIGITRYILKHPHEFLWFPLWYGGIPFQNAYPPLLHMLAAADAWLFGISAARAHHAVSGFFYCLGPVALFLLLYSLSKRVGPSFSAALIFSFASPCALLMHGVWQDMDSIRLPRRIQTLVSYGDGPHVSAITLFLLALLALHLALESGSALRGWLAILAVASVVLTNWIGSFSLAMAGFAYLLARSSSDRRLARTAAITGAICAIAFLLIVPWIPPSTLGDVRRNAQFVVGEYALKLHDGLYWALALLLCGALWGIFTKYKVSLCVQFGSYFLVLTAALALLGDWFGIHMIPQSERYQLEMEIGIAIVLSFAMASLLPRFPGWLRLGIIGVLLIACYSQAKVYRREARYTLGAADVRQSIEYEVGSWFQDHLPGERVLAAGSVQFWLNAFADNPELGGGFGQGIINPQNPVFTYGIPFVSGEGQRGAMWLRVLGVQAVVVSESNGRDAYRQAWSDGNKFKGVLPELWRDGGEVIYGVPQRSASLAHVILPEDEVVRSPINVTDTEPVRKLAAALEDPSLPPADLTWANPAEARITAILQPQQLLLVQESYHPGWHALVNGEPRPIRRDGLGFMLIEPRCNGACAIDLSFDGGTEMRVAYALRILGLAAALAWMALWLWNRRHSQPAGLH